jgi:hypothetical protein
MGAMDLPIPWGGKVLGVINEKISYMLLKISARLLPSYEAGLSLDAVGFLPDLRAVSCFFYPKVDTIQAPSRVALLAEPVTRQPVPIRGTLGPAGVFQGSVNLSP